MLIFTTSTLQPPKTNVASLYSQGITIPGIIYVGRIPTTECDPLYPNVFHQPFFNLHTMTTRIEMQPHLIGVTISKSLQDVFLSDLY